MLDVTVRGKTIEVEDDSPDETRKVVCVRVDLGNDPPGLGVYRYFVDGRRVTGEVADVISYKTERGRAFRRMRLLARAEYIREFG